MFGSTMTGYSVTAGGGLHIYASTDTLVDASRIDGGLYFEEASSNTVSRSFVNMASGYGVYDLYGVNNSVFQSTVTSVGYGVLMNKSSGSVVGDCYVQASTYAVYVNASTGAAVGKSFLRGTSANGLGLWVGGGVGLTAVENTVMGGSNGPGIYLGVGNAGFVSLSSNTVKGARYGLKIATQAAAELSISELTFRELTPGATAIDFLGGAFDVTFAGVDFADDTMSVNVNASLLAASTITMTGASGPRAGPAFANDPSGYVHWAGGSSSGTFAGDFATPGGATYDGGGYDYANGVAVDTFTAGGPFIYEIIQSSQGSVPQAILAKYDLDGVLVASHTWGSGWGADVAVNPNGVYITVEQPAPTGWNITRFDKDLVFVSSALYTDAMNVTNKALTLDIHGNVFVAGWHQSVGRAYRVVKYTKDLAYVAYADFADATNTDMPFDIDTCGQGYVYVTGVSLQGGTTRYLTVKWDNDLNPTPISSVYTTGNPGYDDTSRFLMSVAVNKTNGDAYVVGTNGHSESLLAVKYDNLLNQITTATYSSNIYGAGAAVGPTGDVYASGAVYQPGTQDDEVIVKFDSDLVFLSTQEYVAVGADEAGRIALDEAGKVYMACGAGDASGTESSFDARLIRFEFGGAAEPISFSGTFPDPLRAVSNEGHNLFGVWLAIDTVTVSGPFLYEMVMSTTADIGSSPQDHYLVKYQAQTGEHLAHVRISTTYAQGLAVDRYGNVYAGVSDVVGGGRGRLVKYDSDLKPVGDVEVDPTEQVLDIMRLASDGDFIYANVNGNSGLTAKVIKYDTALTPVASAPLFSNYSAAKSGVAVTPDRSRVYAANADGFSAGAAQKLFKFDSSLASPIEADVTSLFEGEIELAATDSAVYAAEARLVEPSTYVYVRRFDASLNYTGISSSHQVVGPMLYRACQIQAGPDGYVYVSGANEGKAGVLRLDPVTLTVVSSASYAAGIRDQAFGLAVLSSTQVYVAASAFSGTLFDAVVERLNAAGGPTSAITNLTHGASTTTLITVSGTAAGGSGVAAVAVSVQRQSDGKYWNGTSYQTAFASVTASGTSDWTLSSPLAIDNAIQGYQTVEKFVIVSRARDSAGNTQSEFAAGVSSISVRQMYNPPDNVVVTSMDPNSITVIWGANGNPAGVQYHVDYASQSPTNCTTNWTLIQGNVTALTQTLTGLIPDKLYGFSVAVVNNGGWDSDGSSEYSVTTPVSGTVPYPAMGSGLCGGKGNGGMAVALDNTGSLWEVSAEKDRYVLAKYSSLGVFISSTILPGASESGLWSITFDPASYDAYAVGSASGPTTAGADAAVYQVSSSGQLLSSATYNNPVYNSNEVGLGAAVDSGGQVWVSGAIQTSGPVDESGPTTHALALWRYSSGLLTNTTIYYGAGGEAGFDVVADGSDNLWVIGYSSNPANSGDNKLDLVLRKYAPTGASLLAGPFTRRAYAKELRKADTNARLLLSGSDFYAAASIANTVGNRDLAFLKYDLAGSTQVETYWHSSSPSGDDDPTDMALDPMSGDIFVAGRYASSSSSNSLALWSFSPSGGLLSAQTLSGSAGQTRASGVALDASGEAWLSTWASTAPARFAGGVAASGAAGLDGGGGPTFSFTGNIFSGGALVSAAGQNVSGMQVLIDTVTSGGPFYTMIFVSTTGSLGGHPNSAALARYDSTGVFRSSAALAGNDVAAYAFAQDSSGNIYVVDRYVAGATEICWLSKYNPELAFLHSQDLAACGNQMVSDGSYLYYGGRLSSENRPVVVKYDTNLVALATATYAGLQGDSIGLALKEDGSVYVLVSTASEKDAGAERRLLKYPPSFDGASPVNDTLVSGLETAYPTLTAAGGSVFLTYFNGAETELSIRKYDSSLNYTGTSATRANVRDAMNIVRAGSDGNLYVAARDYDMGLDTMLALEYDQDLVLLGSATYHAGAGSDGGSGLAVSGPNSVIATGWNLDGAYTRATLVRLDISTGAAPPEPSFSFTGDFSSADGAEITSTPSGFHQMGKAMAVDTLTPEGPHVYLLFASTSSLRSDVNVLVRYDGSGVVLSSATLDSPDAGHGMTLDSSGNVYVSQQNSDGTDRYWSKYDQNLNFVDSLHFPMSGGFGNVLKWDGASLYGVGPSAGLVRTSPDLVIQSSTTYGSGMSHADGLALSGTGELYMLATNDDTPRITRLLKYPASFATGSAPTLVQDVSSLVSNSDNECLAYAGGNLYVAFSTAAPTPTVHVRKFTTSFVDTGVSATFSPASPEMYTARIHTGPDDNLYVVATSVSGAVPEYLALKYSPELVLLSSATFSGVGGSGGWAGDLAVADASQVFVTGGSCASGQPNCQAATVRLDLSGGGGGGTFSGLFTDAMGAVYSSAGDALVHGGIVVSTATGDVYVAGASSETGRTTAVLVRYDSLGNKISSITLSGSSSWGAEFNNMALDPGTGNLYVAGYASTGTYPYGNYFVKKYSANLQELASRDFLKTPGDKEFRQLVGLDNGYVYVALSTGPPLSISLNKLNPGDLSDAAAGTSWDLWAAGVSSHTQLGGGFIGFSGSGDLYFTLAAAKSNSQAAPLALLRFNSALVFVSSAVPPQDGLPPESSLGLAADPSSGFVYAAYTSGATGYLVKYTGGLDLVASAAVPLLPNGMLLLPDGTLGLGGDPYYTMQRYDPFLNPLSDVVSGFPEGSGSSLIGGAAAVSSTTVLLTGRDWDGTRWSWHTLKADLDAAGEGSIQGTVSYSGLGSGVLCVAISTQSADIFPPSLTYSSHALTAPGPFSFTRLPTPNDFYMTAWLGDGSCADHGSGMPSGAYNSLRVGGGKFRSEPLSLAWGASVSGADIAVRDFGTISGFISALQDGAVHFSAKSSAAVSGVPSNEEVLPSTGPYSVFVATSPVPYQVEAFIRLGGKDQPQGGDPYAVTAPTITINAAGVTRTGINLALSAYPIPVSFAGGFDQPGGASISNDLGWNETGYHVLLDTRSAGGPYAYVLFHSSAEAAVGMPQASGIVKYDASGTMLASATLQGLESGEAFALDDDGNVYTNEREGEHKLSYLVKFGPSLQRLLTVSPGLPGPYPNAMIVSQGYLFVHLDGGSGGSNYVAKYDLATLTLQASKAEAYSGAGSIAADGAGSIYTVQFSSRTAGAPKLLSRYDSGLSSVLASVDVTSLTASRVDANMAAYSKGSLFLMDVSTSGAWLALRKFDATTLAYSGQSATYTLTGFSNDLPGTVKTGPDGGLYVAGSVVASGSADYLALRYDTDLNLVSSATFSGPAGQDDVGFDLVVLDSNTVLATGFSSNGMDFDAATARLSLQIAGRNHASGSGEIPVADTDDDEFAVGSAFGAGMFFVPYQVGRVNGPIGVGARFMTQAGVLAGAPVFISKDDAPWCGESAPHAAYDGSNFLLVSACAGPSYKLQARLVSPSGGLVGSTIEVGAGPTKDAGVAFDGANYFVVWSTTFSAGNTYGQFVKPDGNLGAGPISVSVGAFSRSEPQVAFGAGKYLVVWHDDQRLGNGYDYDIKGVLVSTTGVVGPEFYVNQGAYPSDMRPWVASNGSNFFVAWQNQVGGPPSGNWNISAAIVSSTGGVVSRFAVTSDPVTSQSYPGVVWDGGKYDLGFNDAQGSSAATLRHRGYNAQGVLVKADEVYASVASGKAPFQGPAVLGGGRILIVIDRFDVGGRPDKSNADVYGMLVNPSTAAVLSGTLTYNRAGALVNSGTVRAALLSQGQSVPIRTSTGPFGSGGPWSYRFDNVPAGTYQVQAFVDVNNDGIMDAGDPVGFSASGGFSYSGMGAQSVPVSVCNRRPIAYSSSLSATITPDDCTAPDQNDAYQRLYTFSGSRGQSVTINAEALNFYDIPLRLYDSSNTWVASDDGGAGGGNSQILGFPLASDGVYTIAVSPYAAGLSSATFNLALKGMTGSISGSVSYAGGQGGDMLVGLFADSAFASPLNTFAMAGPGAYSFTELAVGSTFYVEAWVDVNANGVPDAGEDKGYYGSPTGILVSTSGAPGADIAISSRAPAGGAEVSGQVFYDGKSSATLRVEFWADSGFAGQPVVSTSMFVLASSSPYHYSLSVSTGQPFYVQAWLDVNEDFLLDENDPRTVYAPGGQGAEVVYATAPLTGINLTMRDAGWQEGGNWAGEGTASILPSTAAAGEPASLTVVYTAGDHGIRAGGRVGFSLPPGFTPAAAPTVVSTVALNYTLSADAMSAILTLQSSPYLLAGQKVRFVYNSLYAGCQLSSHTFTMTSALNGDTTAQALAAGSPVVRVVRGPPAALQPVNPYFSLTQGVLSDAQTMAARDVCGNVSPATAPYTATLSGKSYDYNQGQFVLDPDVGFSTGLAGPTTNVLALSFATGQSSVPFYAYSASTGSKNMEVFYDLSGPTTFYYGMTALPNNALTGVSVATVSYGAGASSATININSGVAVVFFNFNLGDPGQSWHVLVSSLPFKPGVAPSPVWESWGTGQPGLGQIAWDGRYSSWLNEGVKVPGGLYYARVELGGGGVHNDDLRVSVVLPKLSGRVLDGGVSPNKPLAGANVQLYGPSSNMAKLTDSAGGYSLPGVAAGSYNLFLTRADFLDGSLSLTMDGSGRVSTFTALTPSLAGSTNSAGGLDIAMGRAAVLLVAPSISNVSYSTQAVDLWGSLQVASSGAAAGAAQTYYSSLRVAAGTTTVDDGGQWDAGSQMFIARTSLKFTVAAGTYAVQASLPGFSVSSATVYVAPGKTILSLPPLTPKSSVSGQVAVPSNPDGLYISVSAVSLSSTASGGGGVYLPAAVLSGTYTVANLDPGYYLLGANTNGLPAITTGPIWVPAPGPVDFPAWTDTGSSVTVTVTFGSPTNGDNLHIWASAWSPGALNFGATDFYMSGGAVNKSTTCYLKGLTAGATYQVYVNVDGHVGPRLESQGDPPPVLAPGTVNFNFAASSGVLQGAIKLGNNDFVNVTLEGLTIASARHPENVGRQFSIGVSTGLSNFVCQPSGNPPNAGGYCGASDISSSFTLTNMATETDEITLYYATTGQTKKVRVTIVDGSTSTVFADLSPQTFSISGSINNQVTNALFNTNASIKANATDYAPVGYPSGLSKTAARVTAVLQDMAQFKVAISTVFNPATSRVGFLAESGTWTIRDVPTGVYYVQTLDLRACATCDVLVPAAGQVVNVAGASVSSVTLTLSDGYRAAGSIALDNGLQDARIFNLSVTNARQEVIRSTTAYLGDVNLGIAANSVDYSFSNLPVGSGYTLSVAGTIYPIKYAGRPVKFDLQSNIVLPTILMQRAAYLTGRMQDANTGSLINANNATLLAPNFQITAKANPWVEGGFAQAASSVAARPVQADGTFMVGPLLPSVSYDLRLAQLTWDPSFLAGGSQMYAPATISGLTPQPGQIMDVGVIQLNQGQSIKGVVVSTPTGAALGGIKLSASPSFGLTQMNVVTMTNGQGAYSLWVATAVSSQFDVTVAPRDGNLASDGVRYGQITKRNVIISTATLDFVLQPLLAGVTAQVTVVDAASGGALSYPFGDQRGYPAAAVNLQPYGADNVTPTVPLSNPLGDIAESSDGTGYVDVTGLSTGTLVFAMNVTSLGYQVCKAKVVLSSASLRGSITAADGSATSDCVKPGNSIVLQRGASLSGTIVKFDGTAPTDGEIGGVAAANFAQGEFLVGSVDYDAAAKTVNSYSISGFKPGIAYDIVILPKDKASSISQPLDPNGSPAAVTFAVVESTSSKTMDLTYVSADLDCVLASRKTLGQDQFQIKFQCNKSLRKKFDSDDDLDLIVSVSTCNSEGKNYTAPDGTGRMLGGEKTLSGDRRQITVVYRAAANEASFSLRLTAYAQEMIDPQTYFWLGRLQGRSYEEGRVFDFYAGVTSNATSKCTNIQGCTIELEPTSEDEANGNSERGKVDLQAGSFAEEDSGLVVSTRTLELGLGKGLDQNQAKNLALRTMGYVPESVKVLAKLSAYPSELAAAIAAYRGLAYSTSTVNGANPISSFYNIFLPAGVRHQLKQRADLTLSYLPALSTGTFNPDNVNVYFYNSTLGRFVAETTNRRLDEFNKTITVSVDHFSAFVVLEGAPAIAAVGTV
ncbi:MAG: fibronectin type III domain-containing protein, partial [Elusimicrobia bacterium]|nr:fibronectin type III domain-containing protein [Elusimicrobiota bacterium]